MSERRRTLRAIRDSEGVRHLDVHLSELGDLVIEGQDLGPGVERLFGVREYEWTWTVESIHLGRLLEALEVAPDADVLDAIADRFSEDAASELRAFLERNDVPFLAWSRLGD